MTVTIKLERKLDFRSIAQLTEAFESALGSDMDLDAAEVTQIGTQAVQLILSAMQSCDLMNRKLEVSNAPPAMVEQLDLLGIAIDPSGRLEVRQ